jgi:hypothetical protein
MMLTILPKFWSRFEIGMGRSKEYLKGTCMNKLRNLLKAHVKVFFMEL